MSAFGPYLRAATGGYLHWCPGCETTHYITTHTDPEMPGPCWSFNGSAEKPTFNPSVRIREKQRVFENGEWTGEWKRGPDGEALDGCCHYFIRDGQIQFCSDSTHALAGQTVSLPQFEKGDDS